MWCRLGWGHGRGCLVAEGKSESKRDLFGEYGEAILCA